MKDKNILKVGSINRTQTLKVLDQTGRLKSYVRDKSRKARLPGKRISKTGKIYWETRINRSDVATKDI